jgi:hypothetical protein
MRSHTLTLCAALCLPAIAAAQDDYHLPGYVTAVQPSGEFDIEGVHVHLTPKTKWRTQANGSKTSASAPESFFLGETLDATGYLDRPTHTLNATQIVLVPASIASVSGTAIVDFIPPARDAQPASERTVRADGYLLRITAKTRLKFAAPLTSVSDIATNQWIDYSGVQQLDGTVLLDYAGVGPNAVTHSEDKLRTRTDYNPDTVTDANRQSGLSKFFNGTDVRRIPPHGDETMLARVQRIGESLIPAYQRALPDTDPTKIHFRFQVIDTTKWRDAVNMPSGVIVVPRQVIERLQNDDQLATVIAENIAENIEKDTYRMVPATHRMLAADIAGDAAGIFIPGVGLATALTTGGVGKHLISVQLRQSGRVSLDLLHDAGYDINQAPLAWWLLGPKSPKPIEEVPMPPRAATLYMALGTTWHPAPEPPSKLAAKPTN